MRRFSRRRPLACGLVLIALAALTVAGAASADHWSDYNGSADSHMLVAGDPPLCPPGDGGASFRILAGDLQEGGRYPAGDPDPFLRITNLDVEGGTLSWDLVDLHRYDVATAVMAGGPDAMVYDYDADAPGGGFDDADSGITTPIDTSATPDAPYAISHVDFCFDPKGDGGPKDLVVEKTATTTWEKIYTWDVAKSVDKPSLDLTPGTSGTVQWTVGVTQTGFVARNAVVSGQITVTNPNEGAVTGISVADSLAGAIVDCDGVIGAPYVTSGLSLGGGNSLQCTYTAARDSAAGGTNEATATATLDGVDVSGTGTADFAFGDPSLEINKTVSAVDGKNTWNGSPAPRRSHTKRPSRAAARAGRTSCGLLGDNPATPQVETQYESIPRPRASRFAARARPPSATASAAAAEGGGTRSWTSRS